MEALINNLGYILKGAEITLKLAIGTAALSIPLGIVGAVLRVSGSKILKSIIKFYTWVFRGTPLVLQIYFVYHGLAIISPKLTIKSAFVATLLTFTLNYTAYFIEIFRTGIESIDKGQTEAAKALGFGNWRVMGSIVLPQALMAVVPIICSELVNLVKDTALASTIGLIELSRSAKEIVTREFIISPFVLVGLVYLVLNSFIMFAFSKVEERIKIYK